MGDGQNSLGDLEYSAEFVRRHIGPGPEDVAAMLETVGHDSLDALLRAAVPASIIEADPVDLPPPVGEREALERIRRIAGRNRVLRSMIGCGYHDTVVPPVILRNVLENPGWYTAYTPYQPEISQGRLEALLAFQTMIMDLTGLALANASMLDEATAAAEAMTLCHRSVRGKGDCFVVAADCHPQTIAVVRTRAEPLGLRVVVADDPVAAAGGEGVFGVLVQYPATDGSLRDPQPAIEAAHAAGALAVVAADPLALVLLKSPGEMGADVAVGSTQRFGVPPGFGGPHAAYLATREEWKRSVPGRLVGVSVDSEGRPAYRLALQTREQHIRRDKATSNICTAQVLLANMAGFYAIWHGPGGLARIAGRVHRLTAILAAGLRGFGVDVETESFFDAVTINMGDGAGRALAKAREAGYNLRPMGDGRISIAVDETTSRQDIQAVWRALADSTKGPSIEQLDAEVAEAIPQALRREGPALHHDIFSTVGCETDMLRYLRRLQEKDLALDRCMIPLGSCTMKLNATSEMLPVSWPEFASLHPHVPADQSNGYRELIGGLEDMLCRVTGFDAMSLQPNAGSQGEYSGLLAIRAWHASRDEGGRDVCLIPASAHGTNPASAVLAGMRVVVVACDDDGNVDVADLRAKAAEHAAGLAALMITYPSTHGVYEAAIIEICDIVHEHGGQVYMDGANLNALVGWCLPGKFGADVAHLNLHKTFCIPHGGGGPGVGPIGVRAHLAPFLPGHPLGEEFAHGGAPVAAAPWGSASILPITWMYLTMMGGAGLQLATEVAILNANYIAKRLAPHFPVLYSGPGGLVAHECIVDLRPLKESAGIEVDDVAKRLMDYGFHAPTMSFPVPGTLMIEPTESEPKAEIDRFCEAMIAIRGEIREIEEGRMDAEDNPLKNAPHTAMALAADDWPHPYSRQQAVFPAPGLMQDKYWPPVSRVDNVAGDRNLVCDCPPIEMYRQAAE